MMFLEEPQLIILFVVGGAILAALWTLLDYLRGRRKKENPNEDV